MGQVLMRGRLRDCAGFTLTEVLVSTVVSFIVVLGLVAMDIARTRSQEEARDYAGIAYPSQQEAAQFARQMKSAIETADRAIISSGGAVLQLRQLDMKVPGYCTAQETRLPSCFDDINNYRWDQYSRRTNGDVVIYTGGGGLNAGCNGPRIIARGDSGNLGLTFARDPDGTGMDNVIRYTVSWTHPETGQVVNFSGNAIMRSSAAGTSALGSSAVPMAAPAACSG